MTRTDTRPLLIAIVGPTAVGKTEIAIQLAENLDGEIVSADSRLLYRGMDIGTAKPTLQERQRVPHHLIDVANPDETWSLAIFQKAARDAVASIQGRGKLPFLVGGTGQYIRAVLQGWQVPHMEPNPTLRNALEHWSSEIGLAGLHARLAVLDPQAAANIDFRNKRRSIRALEVILSSGRLFSAQRQRSPSVYRVLTLGLLRPREDLYARVDARIHAMLDAGFIDEVRFLLAQGFAPQLPALSAIGYQEMIHYLLGESSLEDAILLIKRRTRIFVRRQANWFKRNDPDIRWFNVDSGVIGELEAVIRSWSKLVP